MTEQQANNLREGLVTPVARKRVTELEWYKIYSQLARLVIRNNNPEEMAAFLKLSYTYELQNKTD